MSEPPRGAPTLDLAAWFAASDDSVTPDERQLLAHIRSLNAELHQVRAELAYANRLLRDCGIDPMAGLP